MAKSKITEEKVAELAKKSGISLERAREALEKYGGDVDQTLGRLIDAGVVKVKQLDAELVSGELFARAQLREGREEMEKSLEADGMGDAAGILRPILNMLERAGKSLGLRGMLGEHVKRGVIEQRKREERRKRGPIELEKKPFGELKFEDYFWEGKVVLKSWGGFDASRGTYKARNAERVSRRVNLQIMPPGGDDQSPGEPAEEQGAALEYLKENEEEIRDAVLAAIFKSYFKSPSVFSVFLAEGQIPQSVEDLEELIALATVHILNVAKDGMAYVGFEFDCDWDDEHGVGVLTHGKRVVEAEIAHTAYDEHAAENDGGKKMA